VGVVRDFRGVCAIWLPGDEGREEIARFYEEQRLFESGRHSLQCIVAEGARVAVHGEFDGTLRDGQNVRLRFADFFVLDDEGLFEGRDTFFFAPQPVWLAGQVPAALGLVVPAFSGQTCPILPSHRTGRREQS
jgi:hypothetical protein